MRFSSLILSYRGASRMQVLHIVNLCFLRGMRTLAAGHLTICLAVAAVGLACTEGGYVPVPGKVLIQHKNCGWTSVLVQQSPNKPAVLYSDWWVRFRIPKAFFDTMYESKPIAGYTYWSFPTAYVLGIASIAGCVRLCRLKRT